MTDFADGDTLFLRDPEGGFQIIERISTEVSVSGEDTNVMLDGQLVMVMQGITELPADAIGNPTAPAMYGRADLDPDGNVVNDDYDDNITIDDYTHAVFSRGGDDTIAFADGADTTGRDLKIVAGDGDDVVRSGLGDDSISGGYGNDIIDTVDIEFQTGTVESDVTPDLVFGGAGNDEITFDALDAVTGGDGTDTFMQVHRGGDAGMASINDFDPDLERLVIESDVIGSPLVFTDLADGSGSHIELEGVPIMYLVGVTAAQAQSADITLVPS